MTGDLRALLLELTPSAREDLRDVLIRDQFDRDAISSRLMRYCDQNGQEWADIINFLTMYPEARAGGRSGARRDRREVRGPTTRLGW
jgi:hypothetical protein